MDELDRLVQVDKSFPFYLMDVNGFVFHLKEATKLCGDKEGKKKEVQLQILDFVRLSDL